MFGNFKVIIVGEIWSLFTHLSGTVGPKRERGSDDATTLAIYLYLKARALDRSKYATAVNAIMLIGFPLYRFVFGVA